MTAIAALNRRPRRDALPEGLALRAPCGHPLPCGCAGVAQCCESCPLERCRYEERNGLQAIRIRERDPQIIAMRDNGLPVDEIAERFGLAPRSVFRVLAGTAPNHARRHQERCKRAVEAVAK